MSSITPDLYGLSPQQKSAWAFRSSTQLPHVQITWDVEGALDHARLRRALQQVVRRHEILRSRLVPVPGLKFPVQEVSKEIAWDRFDAAVWRLEEGQQGSDQLIEVGAAEPNTAEPEYPVRATLVPLAAVRHALIISAPGTFADYATLRQIIREVAEEYERPMAAEADPPLQYVEYASWREEITSESDDLTQQGRTYWRQQAANGKGELRLTGQRPARAALPLGFVSFRLSPEVSRNLFALKPAAAQSLEALLLACWSLFLYRLTGPSILNVGVVMDGRPYEEFRTGMGPYAQAVPVTMQLSADADLHYAIGRACESLEQAALWQNYYTPPTPTDTQATTLGPFGYSFTGETSSPAAGEIRFKIRTQRADTYPFELKLDCFHTGAEIGGTLVYHSGSLTRQHVERLASQFESFCEFIAGRPNEPVAHINSLGAEDRRLLLVDWNSTSEPFEASRCVHELFDEQSERSPNAIAVVCGQDKLTYQQLHGKASLLAQRLRKLGLRPDVPVCLFIEPSVEMIVGLLAILKAGGAYVPLETAYPVKERVEHVLSETRTPVVVTQRKFREYLADSQAQIIYVDDPAQQLHDGAPPREIKAAPENVAYIIYTSGSTGRPKGVMVQHRSVINLWRALQREVYCRATGPLKVTVNAPISFDASVKQLVTLLGGHELHLIPEAVRTTPHAFVEYIREQRIDVLDCTPSHLSVLLEAGLESDQAYAPSIALIGGEAIDDQLWGKLASSRQTTFYNVYGPTECTVDSTAVAIKADAQVSIGRPLTNVQVYVLEESLQLVLPGATGELCIGGYGVARGYWGAAPLTAERFVPHPFAAKPGERLYRTGDLVRHLPDGSLEYAGRVDHQVKVRGFRVELGEIAAALQEYPGVKEAVIKAFKDPGNTRLVAYFVPSGAQSPAPSALQEFLASRLPEYMIPVSYVGLEALPLNANGKLDRDALRDPGATSSEAKTDFRAPVGEVETALARIWASVLNIEQVGATDNFFRLGGHSLLAMRMIARVRKEFAIDIPLPRLFQLPTIEALAHVIEDSMSKGVPAAAAIPAISAKSLAATQSR
ncbi:MAG TPA: amino acid adenylation domain-containing protein [Candidatus Solibacter sp.]|nr:amino acid adenylation domain-containing protein [Candidatus Solibacter sp.]